VTKVGCDQATGREAPKPRRFQLHLRTIIEPQSRTKPQRRTEAVEHEVGEHKGFTSQVQEEQGRTKAE